MNVWRIPLCLHDNRDDVVSDIVLYWKLSGIMRILDLIEKEMKETSQSFDIVWEMIGLKALYDFLETLEA